MSGDWSRDALATRMRAPPLPARPEATGCRGNLAVAALERHPIEDNQQAASEEPDERLGERMEQVAGTVR